MSAKAEVAALRPASADDIPIRRIGYLIVFVVFGVFGVWSAFAPLDSAAIAPGVVTIKNYRKTVQHLEGGIVREVHVRDGEQVEQGQALVELNDKQFRAELDVVRSQQTTLKALEARLLAEQGGLEEIRYPNELSDTVDPKISEVRTTQDENFAARRKAYQGQTSVLQQRIAQLHSHISGLTEVIKSKRELVASYTGEVDDLRELLAEGFADKQKLREFERSVEDLKGDIAARQADISASQMQIGETELQVLQVGRDFQADVANQLSDVQSKLFDLEERMKAATDRLERTVIRAPVAGTVMGLSAHTVGGVIAAGSKILEIVPRDEELIVEARISPVDVDRVHVGLDANVRFSAFKRAISPVVSAKVIELSADRLVDEANKTAFYLAQVQVTDDGLRELKDLTLIPGMPAEVMVRTGSRTVLGYLLQPIADAFARSFRQD